MKQLKSTTARWGYTHLTTEEDGLWLDEGLRNGYRLPDPAPRWMRRAPVRYIRWLWRVARVEVDAMTYAKIGVVMDGRDPWVCYAILRGWV